MMKLTYSPFAPIHTPLFHIINNLARIFNSETGFVPFKLYNAAKFNKFGIVPSYETGLVR